MDAAIELLLKHGSYIALMVFLVLTFLKHIEKKDETTKELGKSIENVNLNLVALQKDNELKDQVLNGVARSMDKLSDTLSKLECQKNVRA